MMQVLAQDKGVHTESETGVDIPTGGRMSSTSSVGSLPPDKESPRPKAHSYAAKLGTGSRMNNLPVPNGSMHTHIFSLSCLDN